MNNQDRHLILCEDSIQDHELILLALEDLGYQGKITWLKDGEQALQYFANECKDLDSQLLLLDLNMPKVNGFEVLEAIQQLDYCNRIYKVVVSTSHSVMDIEKAKRLGADDFKTKPFDFTALKASLASIFADWFDNSSL